MGLSKDASKMLSCIVKTYRNRLKTGFENPQWFRFCQLEDVFKKVKFKSFDMARDELSSLGLIRLYDDKGFAVTQNTFSYYENNKKTPWIRVIWFIAGLFVEWLLCKGFDIGFDFIIHIIQK